MHSDDCCYCYLWSEVLNALSHLRGHGIQEGVVGVMPQGGVGPQGVGHLLGLEALDGEDSLLGSAI